MGLCATSASVTDRQPRPTGDAHPHQGSNNGDEPAGTGHHQHRQHRQHRQRTSEVGRSGLVVVRTRGLRGRRRRRRDRTLHRQTHRTRAVQVGHHAAPSPGHRGRDRTRRRPGRASPARRRSDRVRHPQPPGHRAAHPLRHHRQQGRPLRRLPARRRLAHRPSPAHPAHRRHPGHGRAADADPGPPGSGPARIWSRPGSPPTTSSARTCNSPTRAWSGCSTSSTARSRWRS